LKASLAECRHDGAQTFGVEPGLDHDPRSTNLDHERAAPRRRDLKSYELWRRHLLQRCRLLRPTPQTLGRYPRPRRATEFELSQRPLLPVQPGSLVLLDAAVTWRCQVRAGNRARLVVAIRLDRAIRLPHPHTEIAHVDRSLRTELAIEVPPM
jgi:hypothetical protein